MEVMTDIHFLDPETLASHFHIEPGSTVVDFGAGNGAFIAPVAKKVGAHGQIIACEIQRPLVEALGHLAKTQNITAVLPVWCDIESPSSTRLIDGSSDFALLINTLHQLEQKTVALEEINRTLRSGGIVYVVDWQNSFGGVGPQADMIVSREEVINLFESAYFIFERDYPAGGYHYGLAFRKI